MADLKIKDVRPHLQEMALEMEKRLRGMEAGWDDFEYDSERLPEWLARTLQLVFMITMNEHWVEVEVTKGIGEDGTPDPTKDIFIGPALEDMVGEGKDWVFAPRGLDPDLFALSMKAKEATPEQLWDSAMESGWFASDGSRTED